MLSMPHSLVFVEGWPTLKAKHTCQPLGIKTLDTLSKFLDFAWTPVAQLTGMMEKLLATCSGSDSGAGADPGIRRGGLYHTHFPKTTPLMPLLRGGAHILGASLA